MNSIVHIAENHLIKAMGFLRPETLPNVNLTNSNLEKKCYVYDKEEAKQKKNPFDFQDKTPATMWESSSSIPQYVV